MIGISGYKGSGKDLAGSIIQYLLFMNDLFCDQQELDEWEAEYKTKYLSQESLTEWDLQVDHSTVESVAVIKKFADPLKDIVCLLIGCTRDRLEDREFKETPLGPEWNVTYVYDKVNKKPVGGLYISPDDVADSLKDLLRKDHKYTLVDERLTPRLILQRLGTEGVRGAVHPRAWVNALMSEYHTKEDPSLPIWVITDMRFPDELEAVENRGGLTIRITRPGTGGKDLHASETALDNAKFKYTVPNNGSIDALIKILHKILLDEGLIRF